MEARLVAKGFPKENQRNMRKDSPTCLNTSLEVGTFQPCSKQMDNKGVGYKERIFSRTTNRTRCVLEASKRSRNK